MRTTAYIFSIIVMSSDPLHKSSQPCPWGPNRPHPERSLASIDLICGKTVKKILSESMKHTASIFII